MSGSGDETCLVTEVRSTSVGAGNYAKQTAPAHLSRRGGAKGFRRQWLLNRSKTPNSPLV